MTMIKSMANPWLVGSFTLLTLTGCEVPEFIEINRETISKASDGPNNNEEEPDSLVSAICDPFGGTQVDAQRGIKASLYDGLGQNLERVEDYFTKGERIPIDLYFSWLNIPTRPFDRGFVTNFGDVITNREGNTLYEWFALNFKGRIKLSGNATPGLYEFALLSDDGIVFSVGKNNQELSPLISANYTTGTRLSCTQSLVELDYATDMHFNLDYFQGPRYHIALTLLWRKVESQAQKQWDPLCGRVGNALFFDSTKNPPEPQNAYQQLMDRGFQVVSPEHFFLPTDEPANPCSELGGNSCFLERFTNTSRTSFTLREYGVLPETLKVLLDGEEITYQYNQQANQIQLEPRGGEMGDVFIEYCL